MLKNRNGFTLPELLIVLLILGILVGIVFMVRGPVLANAKETAWKASMTTVQHTIANAMDLEDATFPAPPASKQPSLDHWLDDNYPAFKNSADKHPTNHWNTGTIGVSPIRGDMVPLDENNPVMLYETFDGNKHYKLTWQIGSSEDFISDCILTAAIPDPPKPPTPHVGEFFTVVFNATSGGYLVNACQVEVHFDKTLLQAVDDSGAAISDLDTSHSVFDIGTTVHSVVDGVAKLEAGISGGATGTQLEMFRIRFKALATGTTAITYTTDNVYRGEEEHLGETVPQNTAPISITITSP